MARSGERPGERVLLFLTRSTETPVLYIPAIASYTETVYIRRGDKLDATINGA